MSTLKISLPESLQGYVESRVARGAFKTPSTYIQALIRKEARELAQEELEELLLEGLKGESKPMTVKDWDDIRRQVKSRLKKYKVKPKA